jgi:hypothetical protein
MARNINLLQAVMMEEPRVMYIIHRHIQVSAIDTFRRATSFVIETFIP